MKLPLLVLACILTASAEEALTTRTWQGIPGLERTAKGRLFVAWYTGGVKEPSPDNLVLIAHSDDDGATFSEPAVMAGPDSKTGRAFDPTLWRDPSGKLWYIYNRGSKDNALHGVYARTCSNPDASNPTWSDETHLGFANQQIPFSFRMNKPTVLSTGEWLLPVTHAGTETVADWFARPKQLQGVAVSKDKGRTWKLQGAVKAPEWALENMIVELRDRRLWMLIRTGSGVLWQSYSSDRGRTWTPGTASSIANPGSRFFIRRLKSGNLLLVNHYKFSGRSHLTAQVSTDDGKTWNDGLLLDERSGVSYPDGIEDSKTGLIRVVYDRDRQGAGEILMATFTEKDAAAGRDVSGKVRLRQVLNKLPWDPVRAANRVMDRLITVTGPEVKGAHDSDFVIANNRAFIVLMANDIQPGENAEWPFVYGTMSVVDLKTMKVEHRIPFAKGGQRFANETLEEGAIFVPRIIQKDARTLRVFFASEAPRKREAQTYYRDFDLERMAFADAIHKARIETAAGVFDMQPKPFYDDAVTAQGFSRERKDFGLYMIDGFKRFGDTIYSVLNNYPAGQNALAILKQPGFDTFQVVGHFNPTGGRTEKLSESAVHRMPDGSWMAIIRQDGGTNNYMFSTSRDNGRTWTEPGYQPELVSNGGNSKPNLEKFFGTYYMCWQESTRVDNVSRSVFNIDVSTGGVHWQRKYRFATNQSFQYMSVHEHRGSLYLSVTQGKKERVMFGKLE